MRLWRRLAPVSRPRVERIAPNPTPGQAVISFAVPARGHVSLAVLDVRGRLVRRVHEGFLDRGWHAGSWDGRDGSGRSLPSGVYFLRLEAREGSATRKLVLIR
ncbi:MAG TPA: FlgD immunoglobulin-like domain containing protein [Acidobacteriota bacterium]|nr:FlgD immunoglobulin-like domain containing protein [Acidobacteriota bacterium]